MTFHCRPFPDVSRPNLDVFIRVDLNVVFNIENTSLRDETFVDSFLTFSMLTRYRVAQKKRGHSVLRLVTLEVLIRSAPNLAQICVISFLTLTRKLFETTLESKMALSIK